jgi:hypothetical protein
MALCDLVLRRVLISGRESGPSQSPAGLANEYSPGMHKIYVLKAPGKGIYSERHPTDRMLNFSSNCTRVVTTNVYFAWHRS